MKAWTIRTTSEEQTRALGARLAERLGPDSVLVLSGPLGAGKTRFVQGLAEGLAIDRRLVTSPTFVLLQQYAGRLPLFHFDVYRLGDSAEFIELGPEEYLLGGGVSVLEWGERVADCLPAERLEVRMHVAGEAARDIEFVARGAAYEAVLEALGGESWA